MRAASASRAVERRAMRVLWKSRPKQHCRSAAVADGRRLRGGEGHGERASEQERGLPLCEWGRALPDFVAASDDAVFVGLPGGGRRFQAVEPR